MMVKTYRDAKGSRSIRLSEEQIHNLLLAGTWPLNPDGEPINILAVDLKPGEPSLSADTIARMCRVAREFRRQRR